MKSFAVVETSVQAMNLLGDDVMVGEFTFTAKHTKGNPAFLDQEGTGRRLTKFCLLRNCRACSTRVRRNVVGRPVRCRFALKVHKGGLSRNLLAAVQLHSGRNLVLERRSTTAGARVEDLPSLQRACLPTQSNLPLNSHSDLSPFTSDACPFNHPYPSDHQSYLFQNPPSQVSRGASIVLPYKPGPYIAPTWSCG